MSACMHTYRQKDLQSDKHADRDMDMNEDESENEVKMRQEPREGKVRGISE